MTAPSVAKPSHELGPAIYVDKSRLNSSRDSSEQISDISVTFRFGLHRSRSHDAVIRVYDGAGKVIATHDHANEFLEHVLGYASAS